MNRFSTLIDLLFADKLYNFTNIHETICSSFYFQLSQKLKQLNIIFLIIPTVKREAVSVFFNRQIFCKNFCKIEQSQIRKRSKKSANSSALILSNNFCPLVSVLVIFVPNSHVRTIAISQCAFWEIIEWFNVLSHFSRAGTIASTSVFPTSVICKVVKPL